MGQKAFMTEFLQLQVLQKHFNDGFHIWVLGMEVFYILVLIIRLYIVVLEPSIGAMIGFIFPLMIFWLLYGKLARISEVSTTTLDSWGSVKKPKWFPFFVM